MDQELKAKWIEALRSGTIEQGRGSLLSVNGAMCCVGVLGRVCGVTEETLRLRSFYIGGEGLEVLDEQLGKSTGRILALMNDGDGDIPQKTFAEIADYIEANL